MGTREVDETQLQSLQNVARSVSEIMKDPKRRMKLLELQKEAEPNAVIPEIEVVKPVEAAIASMNEKFDKLATELQSEREKRENDQKLAEFAAKYEKGRTTLRTRGYSDEGVASIEKLMEERGIANHEDGMAVWERMNPPQEPVKSPSGLTRFLQAAHADGEDELSKQLIASKGNDDFVLDRMIDQIRREGQ